MDTMTIPNVSVISGFKNLNNDQLKFAFRLAPRSKKDGGDMNKFTGDFYLRFGISLSFEAANDIIEKVNRIRNRQQKPEKVVRIAGKTRTGKKRRHPHPQATLTC